MSRPCGDEAACAERKRRAEIMQDMRDGALLATAAFFSGRDIDDLWDEVQQELAVTEASVTEGEDR